MFLVVGLADLALTWYPLGFGNPEWEFGTVSRTYDFLPLTAMGFALTLGASAATGRRWSLVAVSVSLLVVAALLLAAGMLFALTAPVAFAQVSAPVPRLGLKRAVAKAAVQGTLYPLVFAVLGVKGLRRAFNVKPA